MKKSPPRFRGPVPASPLLALLALVVVLEACGAGAGGTPDGAGGGGGGGGTATGGGAGGGAGAGGGGGFELDGGEEPSALDGGEEPSALDGGDEYDAGGDPPPPGCVDLDLDGYGVGPECVVSDCDDAAPWRSPGLPEIPDDGVDDDCDGSTLDAATAQVAATYVANVAGCVSQGVGTKETPICKLDTAIYLYENLTTLDPITYPSPFVVFVAGTQVIPMNVTIESTSHLAAIHGGYDATTWTRGSTITPSVIECTDPVMGLWGASACVTSARPLTLSGLEIRGPSQPAVTLSGEIFALRLTGNGTSHLRDVTLRSGVDYNPGRYSYTLRTNQDVLARDVRFLGTEGWCVRGAELSGDVTCVDCEVRLGLSPNCPGDVMGFLAHGALSLVNSVVVGPSGAFAGNIVVGVVVDNGAELTALGSVIAITNAKNLTGVAVTAVGARATLTSSIVSAEAPTACVSECDSVAVRASREVTIDHSIIYSSWASGAAYENPIATHVEGGTVYRVDDVTELASCETNAQSATTLVCPDVASAYAYDAGLAFVDAPAGDYHLEPDSYGIGLGVEPPPGLLGRRYAYFDVDGEPRPGGDAWDVGIDEQ